MVEDLLRMPKAQGLILITAKKKERWGERREEKKENCEETRLFFF